MEVKSNNLKANNNIFNLTIFFLSLIFFSRLLVYVGFPQVLNHLHYLIFILIVLLSTKLKIFKYYELNKFIFFISIITFISALFNKSSFSNFFLYLLIILEPFLIYFILDYLIQFKNYKKRLEKFILIVIFIHTGFVYIQYFIFGQRHDFVQGLLLNLGNGAHVAGSISILFGIYFFFKKKEFSLLSRSIILISLVFVNYFSDAKQVILGIIVTFLIYIFIKFLLKSSLLKKIQYLFIFIFLAFVFNYALSSSFVSESIGNKTYMEITSAFTKKNSVIEIINSSNTFFNYFFGNGPGHSSSRLSFMIPYYEYLDILSLSKNKLTESIWIYQQSNYETNTTTGSSLFSLFFFWGGIYGDIGILGVIIYLMVWFKIIKQSKDKEISLFFLINILLMGYFYNWPEEPSFIFLALVLIILANNTELDQKINKVND
jgi:hypothetical protein